MRFAVWIRDDIDIPRVEAVSSKQEIGQVDAEDLLFLVPANQRRQRPDISERRQLRGGADCADYVVCSVPAHDLKKSISSLSLTVSMICFMVTRMF